DRIGHGTLMASIIAGKKLHGIAKKSELISIKITENPEISSQEFIDGLSKALTYIPVEGNCIVNCSLELRKTIDSVDRNKIQAIINKISDHPNTAVCCAVGNGRDSLEPTLAYLLTSVITCTN